MRKPFLRCTPLLLGLALGACNWMDPPPVHLTAAPVQAGPFEGQVKAVHADANTVMTERKSSEGTVDTWIEVRPAGDFAKIHLDDRISGRIVVEPKGAYATDIRIVR